MFTVTISLVRFRTGDDIIVFSRFIKLELLQGVKDEHERHFSVFKLLISKSLGILYRTGSIPAAGTMRKKLQRDAAEAFLFLEKENLIAKRRQDGPEGGG